MSAWGIQTGPFASLEANFVLVNFHLIHFYIGDPFHITPKANNGKGENIQLQIGPGPQTGPFAILLNPFSPGKFPFDSSLY